MIATIFARDSAISLHAQVQFHTKYPLYDTQPEGEFTFSHAILQKIFQINNSLTVYSETIWYRQSTIMIEKYTFVFPQKSTVSNQMM